MKVSVAFNIMVEALSDRYLGLTLLIGVERSDYFIT